jgi:hypothetical protein
LCGQPLSIWVCRAWALLPAAWAVTNN